MMESLNNNHKKIPDNFSLLKEDFNQKIKEKVSDKFDLSMIGRIDLIEAEKIAQENVIFLTETDLIEGLEEFELVPVKKIKKDQKTDTDENEFFNFSNNENDVHIKQSDEVENKELFKDYKITEDNGQYQQIEQNLIDDVDQTSSGNEELLNEKHNDFSEVTEFIEDMELDEVFVNKQDSEIIKEVKVETEVDVEILSEKDENFKIANKESLIFDKEVFDNVELLKQNTLSQMSAIKLSDERVQDILYLEPDFKFIENTYISEDFDNFLNNINNFIFQTPYPNNKDQFLIDIKFIEDKLFQNYFAGMTLLQNDDEYAATVENHLYNDSTSDKDTLNPIIEKENFLNNNKQYLIEENENEINNYLKIPQIKDIINNEEFLSSEKDFIEYQDITDKVVIIEDYEMVQKFADKFPQKNRNLVKLLSYLDGLFEKLPEEVIHKFVESDYFDLYSTLLQEMGD